MSMISTAPLDGRDRLIQAALRLAAEKRHLTDLGIRELTRAAGLSPGAFYRHFRNLGELGEAVIHRVDTALRKALIPVWQAVSDGEQLARVSLEAYFRLALVQPEASMVCVCARERYGASPMLRSALRRLQQGLARELACELVQTPLLSRVRFATLEDAAMNVVEHMNMRMLDYMEADTPGRARILTDAERFVQRQFAGAWLESRHKAGEPGNTMISG